MESFRWRVNPVITDSFLHPITDSIKERQRSIAKSIQIAALFHWQVSKMEIYQWHISTTGNRFTYSLRISNSFSTWASVSMQINILIQIIHRECLISIRFNKNTKNIIIYSIILYQWYPNFIHMHQCDILSYSLFYRFVKLIWNTIQYYKFLSKNK